MSKYIFSERAYAKMIFHAAKYPHCAINGILLTENSFNKETINIADVIPLFHQCLYLAPMTEIAMTLIDAFVKDQNLSIGGYYAASENLYENTIDKMPALKLADKIHELNKNACVVILDNETIIDEEKPAIHVYSNTNDSGRWSPAKFDVEQTKITLDAVATLIRRGAMNDITDFDNFFDNPEKDWTNAIINKDLDKILAIYTSQSNYRSSSPQK